MTTLVRSKYQEAILFIQKVNIRDYELVKKSLSSHHHHHLRRIILITVRGCTSNASSSFRGDTRFLVIQYQSLLFSVPKHVLQPFSVERLLPTPDILEEFRVAGIKLEHLAQIRDEDPLAKQYGATEGSILKSGHVGDEGGFYTQYRWVVSSHK